ncbi:MAG: hypothetical protein KJ666_11255 [Bacteroidetes bacterium]|nr:hypothetical protein [Bacteroidota bacterium]
MKRKRTREAVLPGRTKRCFGRLPKKYWFALNQDSIADFNQCPKCYGSTRPRKFALLIHVEGSGIIVLGKTCRYCVSCEVIIAHQKGLESELANVFLARKPEVIGNPYLVIGTVDIRTWRKGLQSANTLEQILDKASDFKHQLTMHSVPS